MEEWWWLKDAVAKFDWSLLAKEVFEPYSKSHSVGARRLLILDSHSSHLTADFDTFCKENAIICLCMPPHSSHLLQPLDVGVFGPLKRAYGKLTEAMMIVETTTLTRLISYLSIQMHVMLCLQEIISMVALPVQGLNH